MEYKFNIYGSLCRVSDEKASFKRSTSGAALRRCEGARKFVRARNEWLYKLAVPYQPFKRESRINLIWRVARFVFEDPVPELAADRSRIPWGCWCDGSSAANRDFRYRSYPCAQPRQRGSTWQCHPRVHPSRPFTRWCDATKAPNLLRKVLKYKLLSSSFAGRIAF